MYGGCGFGMNPMYGNGISSMYGNGISSMYGNGISSMYGNGFSPMHGGGFSSTYGNGMTSGSGVLSTPALTQETNNCFLQSQSGQPRIDVLGGAVIEESPRERRTRLRREKRQELEAIEKHRQQKRQLAIHSSIEIIGHVLQIIIQVMRSGLELFGVAFGTYYSVRALKALVKSNAGTISNAVMPQKVAATGVSQRGRNIVSVISRWKICLLISALFIIMETMYGVHKRLCNTSAPRAIGRAGCEVSASDEEGSLKENWSQSEECSSDNNDSTEGYVDATKSSLMTSKDGRRGKEKKIFVAMYDYDSPNIEGYIGFKAGDRFIIEHYVENGWCEAFLMNGAEKLLNKGFVPGNFLRFLGDKTKL